MAAIRYKVPYEVSVQARDLGSGKPVTNILFYRTQIQGVAPPAYGGAIAGSGDTATLLANIRTNWVGSIIPRLNANYKVQQYVMRAILGKRFSTPAVPIAALVPGAPTTVTTSVAHGLVSGQQINVFGVTTPAGVNGIWTITVTSPTTLSLNGSVIVGVWSGDGQLQLVAGAVEFLYADKSTLTPVADVGLVVGDALPLFATASIRRFNAGIGRNFRSRFSLSPMSEVDALDGGFTGAQKALMVIALAAMNVTIANGGTDPGSSFSIQCVVSKKVAFGQPTPFPDNQPWSFAVSSFAQQPNCGSLVRRKPKLTSVIV
jgi:hypothetical protein